MKFKYLVFTLVVLFFIGLSGCNRQQEDFHDTTVKYLDKDIKQNEPEAIVPVKPEFVNPLSGEATTKELVDNRPVAVMINNIHLSLPQKALSYADIIYEVLEEGGVTRLMAVYLDYENLPEIGSIRSSRDYYIDISDAHDAIYVHCGGSTYAKEVIAKRKTNNIDGMYLGQFYRSAERRKTMAFEHTLMITGKGIAKNIAQKGYRTKTQASQPLKFYDFKTDIAGTNASYIKIPFSLALLDDTYAISCFDYNAGNGKYLKSQYGAAHIDGTTGKQLEFQNVIILECRQYQIPGDSLGCIASEFVGQGTGKYASNGVIKNIVWKKQQRTSSYSLYEEDGATELLLNPGKSYIAIVPTGTHITVQ